MNSIQVWVVKDPDGSIWSTPKGKSSWSSISAAKNAWGCHTWMDAGPNSYNPKLTRTRQGKWSIDAVGWSCEMIAEYEVTKK